MIYEFALDPHILTRWETYDRLVNDCGVEKGRVIADFPNRWKAMVKEEVLTNPETSAMDSQRILFHLQHGVAPKLIPTDRPYDLADPDWIGQAVRAHDRGQPFRAIVTNSNPTNHPKVIVAGTLDREADPLWRVKKSDSIPRRPFDLAALARPLFKISRAVRFVDPHFKPQEPRYQEPLAAFLSTLRLANPRISYVEFHLSVEWDRVARSEKPLFDFRESCEAHISPIVPAGLEVQFFRWRERYSGEGLHPRLILTDRGCIRIDHGLDAGRDGETTPVVLVDEDERTKHWTDFDRDPPTNAGAGWLPAFRLEAQNPVVVRGTAI